MALFESIECKPIKLHKNEEVDECILKDIGEQILTAWRKQGYCILKNTGLPERNRDLGIWSCADEFYKLPSKSRERAAKDKNGPFSAYINGERAANIMVSPEQRKHDINDIKLVFNYVPGPSEAFPEEMPMLENILHTTWIESAQVALKIGKCLGLAYKQDVDYFNKHCQGTLKAENVSNHLRIALYPPTDSLDVKESQMRCSEHKDFVFWSLINQDTNGGLQIQSPNGSWLEPSVDDQDELILIPGELMEIWSQNEISACLHKVDIPPKGDIRRKRTRHSTIYFHAPDDNCMMPFTSRKISYQQFFMEKLGILCDNE